MRISPISMNIKQMAAGNTDALAQFYHATAAAAYALALSMLRNSDAASDAMQEAYLNAYESAADHSPRESALTWFLSLVYRQCRPQESITAEDITTDFTPVAALSLVASLTPREIAKITGLPRKEIPSFKRLSKDTDLAAFCESIPERMPDLCQTVVISALLSRGIPPITLPEIIPEQKVKRTPSFQWEWLACCVPVLVLLLVVVFTSHDVPKFSVANTIYLEGASGICLELDENDQVLNVKACDNGSQPVLQGLNLRNSSVDVAMGEIVDAMASKGYLNEYPDALLLSVTPSPAGQEETESALLKYQQYLLTVLEQKQLPTVLFSQTLSTEDRVLELAEKYQISPGMAGLIHSFLNEPASYADVEGASEFLADKSPFYFYWLMAFRSQADLPLIYVSQTEKMSQYASPEELLSRALYLLTDAKARKPGSEAALTNVYVDANNIYNLSLDFNGNIYHLKISALPGIFLSCTHNGESVSLDFNSKFVGLDTFIQKEKAISLALDAAGYDADSVVFITAEQDSSTNWDDDWNWGFSSSVYPSSPALGIDPPPNFIIIPLFGKYRVTFYSEDMYTYYCVDVDVIRNMVLDIQKTETPELRGIISPRTAVSKAVGITKYYTEDDIESVTYETNVPSTEPYYVIHLRFSDAIRNYFVDLHTGNVIMMPSSYPSKEEAIQTVADHFGLTPEAVYSSQQFSITQNWAFYRVTFVNGTTAYRADVDLASGQIVLASTRPVITLERAYSLVEEKAGIWQYDSVIRGSETNDEEYIIQLYCGDTYYVSRVCRNTGVLLNFIIRSENESLTLPQPPSGTRTKEQALQIALEDLFATVDTVSQITINKATNYYYISFIDSSEAEIIYLISFSMYDKNPILHKITQ